MLMPITGQGMLVMDITILIVSLVCLAVSVKAFVQAWLVNTRTLILAMLHLVAWGSIAGRLTWWLSQFQDAPLSVPFGIALFALQCATLIVMLPKAQKSLSSTLT